MNTSYGYLFAPVKFESINQAVKYARSYTGPFAWRLFSLEGKLIKRGFCDNSPWNGYHGI